ncbi:hypothetical protein BDW42DRAFT_177039 [Aspergillus taichungensis]|uniref:Uncharacterized protein n=1 Tax=Aspergillus taichungensis TaxID=482145 RepID=A0A2J5HJQ0_9EURO|nr:hypothetical protein BDW42DRAFT_177039 [Aspergillus taichungensis]
MGDVGDGDVDLGEDPEDEEVKAKVKKANDQKKKKEEVCEARCLAKDDLVRLMEWKLYVPFTLLFPLLEGLVIPTTYPLLT